MDKLTTSSLRAAVALTAELTINDGRYEQWQELFEKQLAAATGATVKSEWLDPVDIGRKSPVISHYLKLNVGGMICYLTFHENRKLVKKSRGVKNVATGGYSLRQLSFDKSGRKLLPGGDYGSFKGLNSGKELIERIGRAYMEKTGKPLPPKAPSGAMTLEEAKGIWSVYIEMLDDGGDWEEDCNMWVKGKTKAEAKKNADKYVKEGRSTRNRNYRISDVRPIEQADIDEGAMTKNALSKVGQLGYFIYDMGT